MLTGSASCTWAATILVLRGAEATILIEGSIVLGLFPKSLYEERQFVDVLRERLFYGYLQRLDRIDS